MPGRQVGRILQPGAHLRPGTALRPDWHAPGAAFISYLR
ncbi:hypothetical protein JOC24_006643 [Streptomyces sp. HB132]|nr:hypothetical protein [Streptomyces sp. HB132]